MTERHPTVGAPPTWANDWDSIDWKLINQQVNRLQMRIAKAVRENRWGKVKSLQRILTRSLAAKLWATRRVVTNRGRHTPGVDGVLWRTSGQKIRGARSLQRRGYRPQPLRRIHIPKKNGKTRPLSIPTVRDRAMQALHLLALQPVAETLADQHSYGYRPERSVADAHSQCFNVLARRHGPLWIFEGDIESCFDRISHEWLLANIPMDTGILYSWLKAGYLKDRGFYETPEGTPQGGIASPVLANMTLDGLEETALSSIPRCSKEGRTKVHTVRYADDFVITARSREILENQVIPAVERFLANRGLRLSREKSKITHIEAGFNFLGANVRKYNGKLLMKPSRESLLRITQECREVVRRHWSARASDLVRLLNAKLLGWGHHYRHLVASRSFSYLDDRVFETLTRWMRRRHPNKSVGWRNRRYFRKERNRHWIFSASYITQGEPKRLDLVQLSRLILRRHVKIQSQAHPFDPAYGVYFHQRRLRKRGNRTEEFMEAYA